MVIRFETEKFECEKCGRIYDYYEEAKKCEVQDE